MTRRLIPLAVVACAAAAPAPAGAAMTMHLGQPDLLARVTVAVPVTVNCTAFDAPATLVSESASVSISQAVGKQIAHGTGFLSGSVNPLPGMSGPLLWTCDGTDQTVIVNVPAATDGPPFRRAKEAVLTGQASSFAQGPTGFVSQEAHAGPTALKLR